MNSVLGVRTSSRVDPLDLEITLQAGPVYETNDEAEKWTLDPAKAKRSDQDVPAIEEVAQRMYNFQG